MVKPAGAPNGHPGEAGAGRLDALHDVTLTVAAELGRVTLTVGDVLRFGVGSVLELHRSINEPFDLMVQGVRLARRGGRGR
jgi:flagellar motor switch protein FliN/FliY